MSSTEPTSTPVPAPVVIESKGAVEFSEFTTDGRRIFDYFRIRDYDEAYENHFSLEYKWQYLVGVIRYADGYQRGTSQFYPQNPPLTQHIEEEYKKARSNIPKALPKLTSEEYEAATGVTLTHKDREVSQAYDATPPEQQEVFTVQVPLPSHTKPLKDDPIVTNERGGRQSHVAERFDLMPPGPMLALAQILGMGAARYGENNWHNIPISDHINHAIKHLYQALAGETDEDHLGHAMCRSMFALYLEQQANTKKARKRDTARARKYRNDMLRDYMTGKR